MSDTVFGLLSSRIGVLLSSACASDYDYGMTKSLEKDLNWEIQAGDLCHALSGEARGRGQGPGRTHGGVRVLERLSELLGSPQQSPALNLHAGAVPLGRWTAINSREPADRAPPVAVGILLADKIN
jgi:hypothetical protein